MGDFSGRSVGAYSVAKGYCQSQEQSRLTLLLILHGVGMASTTISAGRERRRWRRIHWVGVAVTAVAVCVHLVYGVLARETMVNAVPSRAIDQSGEAAAMSLSIIDLMGRIAFAGAILGTLLTLLPFRAAKIDKSLVLWSVVGLFFCLLIV